MATGRSDYPNQVNNVLGFPFIFRGALDCMATAINDDMKLAASHALARACQGRRSGFGHQGVRRRTPAVRPELHNPQAARPPRPSLGGPRRREGGDGERRRTKADRGPEQVPGRP